MCVAYRSVADARLVSGANSLRAHRADAELVSHDGRVFFSRLEHDSARRIRVAELILRNLETHPGTAPDHNGGELRRFDDVAMDLDLVARDVSSVVAVRSSVHVEGVTARVGE